MTTDPLNGEGTKLLQGIVYVFVHFTIPAVAAIILVIVAWQVLMRYVSLHTIHENTRAKTYRDVHDPWND